MAKQDDRLLRLEMEGRRVAACVRDVAARLRCAARTIAREERAQGTTEYAILVGVLVSEG